MTPEPPSSADSLFRAEVLRQKAVRLEGTVSVVTPVSWQLVGYLSFAGLAAAILFVANASYTRVETAKGLVTLDTGVLSVTPSRAGVIEMVEVREGERVAVGQPLVTVRVDETLSDGDTAAQRISRAVDRQHSHLAAQSTKLRELGDAESTLLQDNISGIRNELRSLDAQIIDQLRLRQVAENDFAKAKEIAGRGFISRRDMDSREALMLARNQQLEELRQRRDVKLAAIRELENSIATARARSAAELAAVESGQAALSQLEAETDRSNGYALTSTVDGSVTAVPARSGQAVPAGRPLLSIIPDGARLQADIYIPATAIGFVRTSQEVRLAIDAFPYERFGTIRGKIASISAAPVVLEDAAPSAVYLAVVELERPWIEAFGHQQRLVPGMSVNARITTAERSLFEWLFEPILAVARR